MARRHPRPRPARSGDERRAARDRRPHPVPRRLLQGAARPRPADRGRSGRLSPGRRPHRLCRRPRAQLGAAARASRRPSAAIAIVLANYPNRDGRIGNGVGLDTPAIGDRDPAALARGRLPHRRHAGRRRRADGAAACRPDERAAAAPAEESCRSTNTPPSSPRCRNRCSSGHRRNGVPPSATRSSARAGSIAAISRSPASAVGNIAVLIQPARGYNIDPKATYHDPALVPPHGYFAVLCLAAPTASAPTR